MPDDSEMSPAFWQALTLRIFRLGVQVALTTGNLSASQLKMLLEVAMYRELLARGYTIHGMSVALNCAPRSVKTYAAHSRSLHEASPTRQPLHSILEALEAGPLTALQLEKSVPISHEFDFVRVALQLLMAHGLVIRLNGNPVYYALSPGVLIQKDKRWEEPLTRLEHVHALGLTLVRLLLHKPCTLEALSAAAPLKGVSQADVGDTLAFLEQLGLVERRKEGPGESTQFRLTSVPEPLIPGESAERTRVGLLDLLDKLGLFLETMLQGSDPLGIGQRAYLFSVRPDDLRAFIREHRNQARQKLEALEARAQTEGGGIPSLMAWIIAPLSRHPDR